MDKLGPSDRPESFSHAEDGSVPAQRGRKLAGGGEGDSVPYAVITAILPWCLRPETYAAKPDLIKTRSDFVRSRPVQHVDAFLRESDAVIHHDALAGLSRIEAPTQITFGRCDAVTSTRFADTLHRQITGSELHVFEDCSHAPIYENVAEFNAATLAFLQKHAAVAVQLTDPGRAIRPGFLFRTSRRPRFRSTSRTTPHLGSSRRRSGRRRWTAG